MTNANVGPLAPITITPNCSAEPNAVYLNRGRRDRVRWQAATEAEINLPEGVFEEDFQNPIKVSPGNPSPVFTVHKEAKLQEHEYGISCRSGASAGEIRTSHPRMIIFE